MPQKQDPPSSGVRDAPETRPIFICYRQLDGSQFAGWIVSAVTEALESSGDKRPIYFDRLAPAVGDWTTVHGPALQKAGSLILVCTPGSYSDQGVDDWVHRELDWWLRNRTVPPILIDTTGEGDRWVPAKIRNRWPKAQRVNLDRELWKRLPEDERAIIKSQVAGQILGAAFGSEFESIKQDLASTRRLNRSLKSVTALLGFFLLLTIGLGVYLAKARDSARKAEETARAQQAEALKAEEKAKAQRAQTLRILEWTVGETVRFPFGQTSLTEEDQQIIRGVIERLTTMGFQGEIIIEGHRGEFCISPRSSVSETPHLAPSSLPIKRCDFYPSVEENLALGDDQASNLKKYISTIPHPPGLVLRTISYGAEKPGEGYPIVGVASDWNRVAFRNNGIVIHFSESAASK
jgi:outer membrane protein OmpA-like peptidoglycan-associated protein